MKGATPTRAHTRLWGNAPNSGRSASSVLARTGPTSDRRPLRRGGGEDGGRVIRGRGGLRRATGSSFVDFVVEIDRTADSARYRLWAELSGHAPPGPLLVAFDACLRSASAAYGALRDRGEIGEPAIEFLPPGTFYRFCRRREREGGPAEQLKVLHSSADPDYVAMFREEARRLPIPHRRQAPGTTTTERADVPSPSSSRRRSRGPKLS